MKKKEGGNMSFSISKISGLVAFLLALAVSANAYTIKYILNGGVNDPDNPTSYVQEGSNLVLKDPTREGYAFLGWFIVAADSTHFAESRYFEDYQGKSKVTVGYYLGSFTVEARWGLVPKTPSQDERGCYLIYSAEELYGIATVSEPNKNYHEQPRYFFNGCASLQNDIVVNENVLDSTGKLSKEGLASWIKLGFRGTFEGNGFKISGLVGENGLFVALGDGSGIWRAVKTHVKNLGIVDSYFYGASVGCVAGEIVGPVQIKNVYTDATVYTAEGYAGGLVGEINVTNDNCPTAARALARSAKDIDSSRVAIIENAYSVGLVEGKYVGGITASMDAAVLNNVYFAGELKGNFKDCIVREKGYTCYESESVFNIENSLCLGKDTTVSKAKSLSTEEFADGTALELLSKGKEGSRWVQEIGTDAYPVIADTLQYKVHYVLNGGVNSEKNPESYAKGAQAFALYDPQKENDEFEGWFTDSDFTQKIDTIRADHYGEWDVYAKWKSFFVINRVLNGATSYIAVDGDGTGRVEAYAHTYTYWSADSAAFVLEEAYRSDGYVQEGWYTDSLFTNKITEIPAGNTEDITVYAKWKYRDYTITYNLYGGVNHPDNVSSWTILDSVVVLKEPTREGAEFYRWTPCRLCYEQTELTYHASYSLLSEWFPIPKKPKQDSAKCFLLTNKEELYWFAGLVNGTLKDEKQDQKACASLQNDIVVNGVVVEYKKSAAPGRSQDTTMNVDADSGFVWTPIAAYGTFSGSFYGNGHSISGLMSEEKCGKLYGALFCGVAIPDGIVKDVEVNNSHIKNQGFFNHILINTEEKHALPSVAAQSGWHVDVRGNSVALEGLVAGRPLLVMDMQGRILHKMKAQSSMTVNFSNTGKFLIRYGNETRVISVHF